MFERKNLRDVCYCETCRHETAKECIELNCICCAKPDKIRLEHVIVPEDDLSPEEKQRRAEEQRTREEEERENNYKQQGIGATWI